MSALFALIWSQFGPYIIAGLAGFAAVLGYRAKVRTDLKNELTIKDQAHALDIAGKAADARTASARDGLQSNDGFKRD